MIEPRYALVPEPVKRSRLERNPLWKIPLGVLLALGLGVAASTPGLFFSQRVIHSSGAYQQAVACAQRDPEVAKALGGGWKPGGWTWGHFREREGAGYAQLSIPVAGPIASGKLKVWGREAGGIWRLQRMCLSLTGQTGTLDLLRSGAPPAEPRAQSPRPLQVQ